MKDDYKYDDFGNLDTDYYVEKAYELRNFYYAQAINTNFAAMKSWLVKLTSSLRFKALSLSSNKPC